MASIPAPTKPPRGVKNPKESSGSFLMTVIRTLSTSESNEQRDREKAKLEKDYQKCDKELDQLISQHDKDLAQVMQTFARVSQTVNTSRAKISCVKENLLACKTLLSCRRDELKKLWLEGVEHKHTLQLLEEISQIKEVPSQLSGHLAKKHYLHATQVLVSALALGNTTLEDVEALKELRTQLHTSKQQLYSKLLEELTRHIYVESTQDILTSRLFRQDSMRNRESTPSNLERSRRELTPGLTGIAKRESFRAKKRLDFSNNVKTDRLAVSKVTEDVDLPNPEEDSEHFMSILIECLGLLNKLPEAIESLKVEMQTELLKLVERTTKSLVGTEASSPLLELLLLLMEQFRAVVDAHSAVLGCVRRTAVTHKIPGNAYDLPDVWARIQQVMQLLLTDYLDIQNSMTESHQVPSTFTEQSSNISSYFARRKQTSRSRRSPLFKFENSSHALTMMKESSSTTSGYKRFGDSSQREKVLVCQPDPNNIKLIFVPLSNFLEEIESAMNLSSGTPCTLNAFLSDYIKDTFIRRQHSKLGAKVETATKCQEAWKVPITPEQAAELGLPRPLLQSTVLVEESMQEMCGLMKSLPSHAGSLLAVSVNVIHSYREICQAAYRGIVQPHSEDKRVCSAAWLNDEDISRFLKSLPNWTNLKMVKSPGKGLKRDDTVEEESPEDVRQRNIKEAEILASNLAEGGINSHEIIADITQLKCLALLQESMEWFSLRVLQLTSQLQRSTRSHASPHHHPATPVISVTSADHPAVPEGTVIALENLAHEFQELANTCLLVLHLEVRVQCFYYLLPRGTDRFNTTSQDPDPKVTELSRVLTSIDEAMTSSLQPRKSKYVFEGLGHLIAKILMSSSQFLETIDESGIHKMCRNIFTMQQTLTNITMAREVALDHANHYFQLFYHTPEDILNRVLEEGPEFSELEYMNAFQLIHRSQGSVDPSALQRHLQRLSDILGEVGVTV